MFTETSSVMSVGGIEIPSLNGKTCTVHALGALQDDVPNILSAFTTCNNGGTIIFPSTENYYIASQLHPILSHVTIEWRGTWTLSDNLTHWRDTNNTIPIHFQNHHAQFTISGDHIHIHGHDTGRLDVNGNAWYDAEQAVTQPVRPMNFVWWNASEVLVEHFSVIDPPLWSINLMNVSNAWFHDIYVNATAVNAPYDALWVQNTDGFDTLDCNNVKLTNFVYQGGDDCIAIKPRSYNTYVQNVTCHGGNGIAIGSLGQYQEDSSVINAWIKDVNILIRNTDMHNSAYIKTWMGASLPQSSYNSAGLPNGGGWGVVQNLRFENFWVQGAALGPSITQDNGDNGSYAGTSKMEISNIAFVNFTGYTLATSNETASISCSNVHPCFNIALQNVTLAPSKNGTEVEAYGSCDYTAKNGVTGMIGHGC
ncbi:putative galacturan 1,4-alpha-galacturonidase C [Mollisia scopiformis]|uniref:galacturonan 1,4-alpha-galacturonidase n=1 Tax=Mollisia scopiformis TaxID=149040 RepID=A0A132B6P9_MOLSC|nr:putative galacturan 1,4-alpha-galacturonidase C [Mollisia scopiformis]KUJ08086.1 putative galacturan 1,4-alpha-galacturonidase C [Mollisia scopiformis]